MIIMVIFNFLDLL